MNFNNYSASSSSSSQHSTQFCFPSSLMSSAVQKFQFFKIWFYRQQLHILASNPYFSRRWNGMQVTVKPWNVLCLWIISAVAGPHCVSDFSRGLMLMELLLTNLWEWTAALCERCLSVHDNSIFLTVNSLTVCKCSHLLMRFNVVSCWIWLHSVCLWVTSWGGFPSRLLFTMLLLHQGCVFHPITQCAHTVPMKHKNRTKCTVTVSHSHPLCILKKTNTFHFISVCNFFAIILFFGLHFSMCSLVASDDDPAGPV